MNLGRTVQTRYVFSSWIQILVLYFRDLTSFLQCYEIPCINCNLCYIGETGRKFNTRLEEHKSEVNKVSGTVTTRAGRKESLTTTHKSAITDHVVDKNHVIGWGEAKIIGTEQDRYKRWIKEAIAIRKKGSTTMNRDEGQYFLSHVFDEILMKKKTPNWQINWQH